MAMVVANVDSKSVTVARHPGVPRDRIKLTPNRHHSTAPGVIMSGKAAVAACERLAVRAKATMMRGAEYRPPIPRFCSRCRSPFSVAEPKANYHIALLVTPWSFST
jgi:5-hydroxyisourate hydrolase-like protein (transthyretin family)